MRQRRNLPVLAPPAAAADAIVLGPAIPQHFATPGLSLQQIFAIMRAYRWRSVLIAALILALAIVYARILPKIYTATATLMVSYQQQSPLEGIQQQGQQQPLGTYMATEIQLMLSAEALLPVIERLALTRYPHYTAGYQGDGSNLPEWVEDVLYKDLDIEPGPAGSQLIYVTAAARSPELAANIANTLATTYLAQERERLSGPASERATRYAAELAELKDKVRLAQDQVTAFRQRTGVTDTPSARTSIDTELLASLETRLQEAQNARRAAEVKAATAPSLNSGPTTPVPIQTLKTQIDAEKSQLAQALATLGARHPKVLELQRQIEANERSMEAETRAMSTDATSELGAARDLEAKLKAAVDQQRAKVISISRVQDEGTKYELELESAQNVYKRALDGYDQIMFASDSHFSNVTLVTRAVPPQRATKPNKVKLVVMGAFAGLILGLGAPLGYELLLNRRIRCRDDFEREFQVHMLMEFERIPPAEGAA